jgi:hypothetical protein
MKVFVFLLIALCAFQVAVAQLSIVPADQSVTLNGMIREVHGYGPPGYGEDRKTDSKVTYLVIELPKPINVPCTAERPEWASVDCQAAKRLKLFIDTSSGSNLELMVKKMIGRRISLTGTIHRAETVGEMTPIYFEVTAIHNNSGDS